MQREAAGDPLPLHAGQLPKHPLKLDLVEDTPPIGGLGHVVQQWHGEPAARTLAQADRFDRRAVSANEDVVPQRPPDPVLRFAEQLRDVGCPEVGQVRFGTAGRRRRTGVGQRGVNLGAQRLDAGGSDDGVIESIDGPDLMAQRHIDRVVSALSRAFKEVRAHPQGETVPLEHEAEPADVLLPGEVLAGVGNPDITTGGDGVAQSGDDLLDLG